MKRSHTRSIRCRRPADDASGDRRTASRSLGRLVATLGLLVVFGAGCVSGGKYDAVVAEREELDQQRQDLEKQLENARAGNESLALEIANLLEDFEDVRISREQLEERVSALSATKRALSMELETTSTELERSKEELARTAAEVEKLNSTYANLVSDLEAELASGQIQIEQLKEGLRVNVADEVLFASGSATLDSTGRKVLVKVAKQLASLEHRVEVQGHTDNIPIRGSLTRTFPTNWELAAARAARVARLLQEQGVHGDRLIVASFAEFKPLAPNSTADGRAMNRRIEIRLLPLDAPVADLGIVEPAVAAQSGSGASDAKKPAPTAKAPGASKPVPASAR